MNVLIDEQLTELGLSRPQLHVLAFLNRAGDEVRMTEIGTWLGVTKAHVTRLVNGLEGDGMVAGCQPGGSPHDSGEHHSGWPLKE